MLRHRRRLRQKSYQKKEKSSGFKEANSLTKENQSDFFEQIEQQNKDYRDLNLQKHNDLVEQEKQLQLQYHKQINLKCGGNYND